MGFFELVTGSKTQSKVKFNLLWKKEDGANLESLESPKGMTKFERQKKKGLKSKDRLVRWFPQRWFPMLVFCSTLHFST